MGELDLRGARSEEELWAARYEARFRERAASYYAGGLNFVPAETRLALDAGCGSGAFALPLAGRVGMVVGLDRNRTLIELAQARQREAGIQNVAWVVADIERMPFAQGAFDFVGTYNVLHVVPLQSALMELTRCMREGGRLVVRLPYRKREASHGESIGMTLRRLRYYARLFGVRTGWRLIAQERSAGFRAVEQYRLPPEVIEAALKEALPGCRVRRDENTVMGFWRMADSG